MLLSFFPSHWLRMASLTLVLIWGLNGRTQEVHLIEWRPEPGLPVVVLPRLSSETPEQAVRAYVDHLYLNPSLRSLIPPSINLRAYNLRDAHPFYRKSTWPLLSAFKANQIADLVNQDNKRAGDAIASFQQFMDLPIEPYVIGFSAAHRLSARHQREYDRMMARLWEFYVGLGGEDWTPYDYGESQTGAVDYNTVLDTEESDLRREMIRVGKAYRVELCRSFQSGMCILRGMTLIQDLQSEGYGHERDHRGPPEARVIMHPIQLRADSRIAYYLRNYIATRGLRPVNGLYTIPFNSWHHQAVDLRRGIVHGPLLLDSVGRDVAWGPHGILEMVEGPNFIGTQGHLELPVPGHGTEVGDLIIRGALEDAFRYRRMRELTRADALGLTPFQVCNNRLLRNPPLTIGQ